MRGWLGCVIAAGLGAALAPGARAEGIYVCVDAKGRRLTSDRPILECIDREQTVLGPSGQVLRKVGPSLTAHERAAQEETARLADQERKRRAEEKKRDLALLARYPDPATHDHDRHEALAAVDDVIQTAMKRIDELHAERKRLDTELEFYKGDAAQAPPALRRKLEENDQQVAAQRRFIANQEDEKKRVNARYDAELARLRAIWARQLPAPSPRHKDSAARP